MKKSVLIYCFLVSILFSCNNKKDSALIKEQIYTKEKIPSEDIFSQVNEVTKKKSSISPTEEKKLMENSSQFQEESTEDEFQKAIDIHGKLKFSF